MTIFKDPEGVRGFFEQKIIELEPGRLLAAAWTVRMGDYADLENHFAISGDGGLSWGQALSTGIRGQTLTPVWLEGDRLLVLYNRRSGRMGIQVALVRFTDSAWSVEFERTLWDAQAFRRADQQCATGTDDFETFAFGLPCAIRLDPKMFLAAHWCRVGARCTVRWTRLRVD
jgi:sialidase-1